MTTRTAQLLDADRRVVARVPANTDTFSATLDPAAFERCVSCRLIDETGHVLAEVPITRGGE